MSARILQYLDPNELPPGQLSKLQVEIGHDGLGRPMRLPVLAVRGRKPGPVLGITAALHGNELNGIPVVQKLLCELDAGALHGTVIGVVVVNVPGYLANERQFMNDWDLNHLFPGKPRGNSAQVYVHRLLERIIKRWDILVDLHTASFGRTNSLYIRADMSKLATARMAYLMQPQIIVHNPANDKTLRGHMASVGVPAITVEVGNPQRYQGDFIKRTLRGLRAVLMEQKMIRPRPLTSGPEPILCRRSDWTYTDMGGLLEVFPQVTDPVSKGEPVAELRDPWGDVIQVYRAPADGVIIGRSANPVAATGARIIHLGRLMDKDDDSVIRRDM